jgi:hypothetical protein
MADRDSTDPGRGWAFCPVREIDRALLECSSTERLAQLWLLWRKIPVEHRPVTFCETFVGSDPQRWQRRLLTDLLPTLPRPVFDTDAAREAWAALPERFTAYRGLAVEEYQRGPVGLSWTLDPERARFFAFTHRFAPRAGCVVAATIGKSAVAALLFDRGERELLLMPGRVRRSSMTVEG